MYHGQGDQPSVLRFHLHKPTKPTMVRKSERVALVYLCAVPDTSSLIRMNSIRYTAPLFAH